MNLKIFITSNVKKKYEFCCECNKDISVEDFLKEIKDKFFTDFNIDDSPQALLGHFNFINDDVKQKAKLDFNLLAFLNNFNYELDSIHMEFLYGIGDGFDFKSIAWIYVNGGEPHARPHVHIYSNKKTKSFVRIVLSSMTQMKGDSESFADLFKRKERNEIIKFLKENKEKLEELYIRTNKGEFITDSYTLTYDGKKYITYHCGRYN